MMLRCSWILAFVLPLSCRSFDGRAQGYVSNGNHYRRCGRHMPARIEPRPHQHRVRTATPTRQHHRIDPFRPQHSRPSFSSTSLCLFPPSLRGDPSWCLSSILLLSVFGLSLERRTTIGKALSAPLSTMALAILLSNLGFLPFESPVYAFTNRYLVSLAVPMLLYDSDVRRIFRETGSLLAVFGMASFATIAATLAAFRVVPMTALANDAHKVAAALCARHIGGAINFVAVAETLRIAPSVVSAAMYVERVTNRNRSRGLT
jgi:Protein of unknown function (DUF819)